MPASPPILSQASSLIAERILSQLQSGPSQPDFAKQRTLLKTHLQKTALQYLKLDPSFAATLHHTLEVAKTLPTIKAAYNSLAAEEQALFLSHLNTHFAQSGVIISQTQAASSKYQRELKSTTPNHHNLVAKIAQAIAGESTISADQTLLAQKIIEAIKVSAALNTDPQYAVSNTLDLALANYPQSTSIIRRILIHESDLQAVYELSQSFIINVAPTKWMVTANLNHQPSVEDFHTITAIAESHQVSPFSTIIATLTSPDDAPEIAAISPQYPSLQSTQSLEQDVQALQQVVAPSFTTASLETALFRTQTTPVATKVAVASEVSPPALLITVALPYLQKLAQSPPLSTTSEETSPTPSSKLSFSSLSFPSLAKIFSRRTGPALLGGVFGALTGTMVAGPTGAIVGTGVGSLSGLLLPKIPSQALGVGTGILATPFFAGGIAIPGFISGINRLKITSFIGPVVTATIVGMILLAAIIHSADLGTFLQPLTEPHRNQVNYPTTPGTCAPSRSPYGSIQYRFTQGYSNNGINCYNDDTYHSHPGVDLAYRIGTPIQSSFACNAQVAFAGPDPDEAFGNFVALKSGEWFAYYAHLSSIDVQVGDIVAPGQIVGAEGQTGNADGSHLHYEIRRGAANPQDNCQQNLTVNPCDGYGIRCSIGL